MSATRHSGTDAATAARRARRSPHGRARRAAAAALAAALLSGGAAAAIGQAPEGQAPIFPAGTELVLVDAVVLDGDGSPVEGLGADDFTIREDGVVQTVQRFEAIALAESAPSRSATARFVATNRVPDAARRTPPRSFAVVFDDAQLSRVTGERARAAIVQFLERDLRPDDELLLVSTASGVWWSGTGAGQADFVAVLGRLEGRRPVDTSGSRISDYEALRIHLNRDPQLGALVARRFYENGVVLDSPNSNAAQARRELDIGDARPFVQTKAAEVYYGAKQRTEVTLKTLERVADALGEGKGRKSVLLVSDGFVFDNTLPDFRAVVRAMGRANAVVYFLDARGLPGTAEHADAEVGRATQERDVLAVLGQAQLETEGAQSVAADTGGFAFRNPNDLARGMSEITRELRAYYLIGYISSNTRRDGKYRKIEVAVARPGVKVRARKGYYAGDAAPAGATTAAGLDARVRRTLDSPFAADGIPLRMAAYVFAGGSAAEAPVLLVADADPSGFGFLESKGRFEAALDSYLVVTSRDTGQSYPVEKKVELSLPPEVKAQLERSWLPLFRDVRLPPGTYQARLLLRESRSGRIGSVRHEFTVPPADAFRLSTPVLTDSLQPDAQAGAPRPVPLARRAFVAGSSLVYAFEVYGAARDPETGSRSVVSRYEVRRGDGTTLARTEPAPIVAGPRGELSRQTSIPLAGLAPGEYEIVLSVEDRVAGRALELRDPFSVVEPPPSPSSDRP